MCVVYIYVCICICACICVYTYEYMYMCAHECLYMYILFSHFNYISLLSLLTVIRAVLCNDNDQSCYCLALLSLLQMTYTSWEM